MSDGSVELSAHQRALAGARRGWAALRRWSWELDALELREPWLVWATAAAIFVLAGFAANRPLLGVVVATTWVVARRAKRPSLLRQVPSPPVEAGPSSIDVRPSDGGRR